MAEVDASVEEQEFQKASEEYMESVAEKARWTDEAKHRLDTMKAKHKAVREAREGKTTLSGFAEEEEGEPAAGVE